MMTFVELTTIQGEPFRCAALAASNLYPVGTSPYQDPSCNSARAQGSKGDGTLLPSGMLQPAVVPVTHPTLESVRLFRSSPVGGSTERHVAASRRTGHTSHLGISKVVSVVSSRRF